MKKPFPWLLAGLLALLCAIAPARAQNTILEPGLASLAQATDALVALSADGALLRSTDNGVNFSSVRPADSPRALYALAASGSTVVAMGDAMSFCRSTNSGQTYTTLVPAVGPVGGEIRGLAARDGTWLAVGISGTDGIAILRSTDDGATWSAASVPTIAGTLTGVAWTGDQWLAVGTDDIGAGLLLASPNGATWTNLPTTFDGLNAIASDGAGKVLVAGVAGTILYATDGGATAVSFSNVGNNIVSEDLQAVAYLSGDNWIIGGDSGVLVSFNGTAPAVLADPDPANGAPVTALLWTGSGANYYVSSPSEITPPEPHGPISLQIALVSGQLQLTLVGAEDGNSYHITTSTTLASFTAVAASTQAYSGGPAPTWNFPVPAAGGRVFYRAVIGVEP